MTASENVEVTQADRDAVQGFHREMGRRLMADIKTGSSLLGTNGHDGDAIHQAFARHRLASAAPARGEGDHRLEVARLQHVIDRDRYAAAACVRAVEFVLHTRRWLREPGRGSYAYDDERYQEEFGLAFDEIQEALRPMRALASDKTDCTRDEEKVKVARIAGAEKFAAALATIEKDAGHE